MHIILAPMEGLLDHTLRDVLTRVGGVHECVSEFIRVTNTVLPRRLRRPSARCPLGRHAHAQTRVLLERGH